SMVSCTGASGWRPSCSPKMPDRASSPSASSPSTTSRKCGGRFEIDDLVDERLGIVVPHRAQRAALRQSFPQLCIIDPASGLPVERFQSGERTLILVSATESDPAYLLASCEFLLDPRRLTVALSRAKRKMILVASRSIFSLFST